MKKISFFIAVILSLNAGIVVRKEDEENSVQEVKHCSAQNKPGTHLWLQQFIKRFKTGFYLINRNGKHQKIEIINNKTEFLFKTYNRMADNIIRYNYTEIIKKKTV